MKRPRNCVRFTIDTSQLQTLLNLFHRQEAYYIFVPYPLNSELIKNRKHLLQNTITMDVYNVPKGRKTRQKTRTVRCYPPNLTLKRKIYRRLKIADPRKFETIDKTDTLDNLAGKLIERKIGLQVPLPRNRKEKKISLRNLFYIHLASE
jgi:hypothetical protein